MASKFEVLPEQPADAIFGLLADFNKDTHPQKVNLVVGAYRTNEGEPYVLPSVKMAIAKMSSNPDLDHEYSPIEGHMGFVKESAALVLGRDSTAISENRVSACQCISGSNSLYVGANFLRQFVKPRIYIPNVTWANHKGLFVEAGLTVEEYPYYCPVKNGLDYDTLIAHMKSAEQGSVYLLQACAHNPTGVDPSREQWKGISAAMKERDHFAFFDCAYQGFATGDLDSDAWAVRYFASQDQELSVAQSYSKNMGLYGERVGCLVHVANSVKARDLIHSQVKKIIRTTISNAPLFGARVAYSILSDETLFNQWKKDIIVMSDRIKLMRHRLFEELSKLGTPGDWTHILKQIGMFTYTGLDLQQSRGMVQKHHVFMTKTGRISMAGLTEGNIGYVAQAVHDVVSTSGSSL